MVSVDCQSVVGQCSQPRSDGSFGYGASWLEEVKRERNACRPLASSNALFCGGS